MEAGSTQVIEYKVIYQGTDDTVYLEFDEILTDVKNGDLVIK